jgi:tRNA A-37 threonylcarbamoyl transferase component Bud32
VIKALEALHDAGYTHGSIQPSNVLNKQGTPVLIDLEFAKGDHKCDRVASVTDNGLENKSGDFKCSEICHAARKMDLWKKSGQFSSS